MRGATLLRRLVSGRQPSAAARSSDNLIFSSVAAASCCTVILSQDAPLLFSPLAPLSSMLLQSPSLNYYRAFSSSSSSSSSDPSKVVLIESEEHFNDSLRKVQEESLPAIFYFTAVWCGPCRLLSPIIAQLSEKYPHVTTYKIDIDKEGLTNALSKLNINAVPTLHFFQNGKKASEVVGADVQRLKDTMEALYK